MTAEFRYVVRFLLVGVLNTAVGLGSIYACKYFFSFGDVPANAIGYLIGLTNSFLWNRNWTFRHSGKVAGSLARFALVFVLAYAVNLTVVLLLIRAFGVNSYLAHALATLPYTVIFYLGSRHFAFAERQDSKA